MKTLKLLLISTCLLLSCSKDDNAKSTSLIVGKWATIPGLYEWYTNGLLSSSVAQSVDPTDYVEFKSDGTMQSKAFSSIYNNQYKIEYDTLVIDSVKKGENKHAYKKFA